MFKVGDKVIYNGPVSHVIDAVLDRDRLYTIIWIGGRNIQFEGYIGPIQGVTYIFDYEMFQLAIDYFAITRSVV